MTDDTSQLINRSTVRAADDDATMNQRLLLPYGGEMDSVSSKPIVSSNFKDDTSPYTRKEAPTIRVDDLVGPTFLSSPKPDGTQQHSRVARHILNPDLPGTHHFLIEHPDPNDNDEIITYNDLMNRIESEHNMEADETYWRYKAIIGHRGPLKKGDDRWKGCEYYVKILWESGETTWEPRTLLDADDPVTLARYTQRTRISLLILHGENTGILFVMTRH